MTFDPPNQPPAGWYPDPYRPGDERWWNGRDWEERWHTSVAADALPEIGPWLNQSFSLGFGRWRATAVITALTSSFGGVLIAIAGWYLTHGVVIFDDEIVGWNSSRLPVGLVLVAAALLVSTLGTVAITVLMLRTADEEQAGSAFTDEAAAAFAAIRRGLLILPRAIGWMLLLMLALLVPIAVLAGITVVVPPLGVILFLALMPALAFLAVRLAFVAQSLVDEPGEPYGRSFDVSRGRWWAVLGRILLLGILIWLISIVIQTIGGLLAGTGTPGFSQRGIETGSDGTFARLELGELFAISPWSLAISYVTATVISVIGGAVGGVGFALLYRTRNPVAPDPFADAGGGGAA